MKLSQAQNIMRQAIRHNLSLGDDARDSQYVVPCIVSSPGLGKTTMVKDTAKQEELDVIIMSLAQQDAAEIAGWMVPNADTTAMTRLRPHWLPDSGKGILFLDEIFNAPVANQNIAAQLVNERRVGDHHLPSGWTIVCAGNKMSDRAGNNSAPSHLKDRMQFLSVELDLDDLISYYVKVGVDPRITGYLQFRPEWAHKFDRNADSCPSPRSWERVSSMLQWDLDSVEMIHAIAGQVGEAAAADFHGYLKMCEAVPDIDALISKPDDAEIPEESGVMFAVAACLSHRFNKKNAGNIIKYLMRLPQQEFTAFVLRPVLKADISLKSVPAVREWLFKHGKTLAKPV